MADDLFDPPKGDKGGGKSGLEKSLTGKVGGVPVWGIGLLMAAALVAFFIIRRRNSNAAAAASAASTATDTTSPASDTAGTDPYPPDGTMDDPSDPYSTDSATGITYGNEAYTGTSGTGYPGFSDTSQSPSYPVGLPPQGLPGPTTNVQWARLAGDYLLGKGDDPSLVNNALNNYISGKPLTTAEQAIVNLALETFGEPPEGVTPIIPDSGGGASGGTGTGGSGGGTAGSIAVPNVEGKRAEEAHDILTKQGFTVVQVPPQTPKGQEEIVKSQTPKAGTMRPKGSPVTIHLERKPKPAITGNTHVPSGGGGSA